MAVGKSGGSTDYVRHEGRLVNAGTHQPHQAGPGGNDDPRRSFQGGDAI